jgi:carbonic anhydrase/acetyltransferase-like protein (isoleucine patch superfamily)
MKSNILHVVFLFVRGYGSEQSGGTSKSMKIRIAENAPEVAAGAFVAPDAVLAGSVRIQEQASVWFGAVLRADFGQISVGQRSNVQERCVFQTAASRRQQAAPSTEGSSTKRRIEIGNDTTIGAACILRGCKVGHGVLVGTGTTILDDVTVGDRVLIAPQSVLGPGSHIPSGTLVRGQPAQVVAELSEQEITLISEVARDYVRLAAAYISALST